MTAKVKQHLMNGVRIVVCVAGLFYIGYQITWSDYVRITDPAAPHAKAVRCPLVAEYEDRVSYRTPDGRVQDISKDKLDPKIGIERGLPTMIRHMDGRMTLLAALTFIPVLMICSVRFVVIMATQGIHLSIWEGIKITYAGAFLNFAMPGATGGDLYRAYCATRHTHRKTEAVTAVFIDRVIGLGSLMIIGGFMSLVGWAFRLNIGWAARAIGALLLVMIVGGTLYFSRTFRRLIRYERILQRLPLSHQLQRVDQAIFTLSNQKRRVVIAALLTATLQMTALVSLVLVAKALGMRTDSITPYLVYLPLGMVVRAIPVSIQGAGPMDYCYQRFFVDSLMGTPQQVQVLALAVRLLDLLWAIPGVLVLLTGKELPPKDFLDESDSSATSQTSPSSAGASIGVS